MAALISYIDIKRRLIPDPVILPSIAILLLIKLFENTLSLYSFIAVALVLIIFLLPIIFNMNFGGGDLRFGAFCALFLGLAPIGWFVMLSGALHVTLLAVLKKRSFGFAPAMSLAAVSSYFIG